jgi:hypothetical protein
MEKTITANLTEIERNHLLSTLTKIHRSASDLLSEPIDHGESPAG